MSIKLYQAWRVDGVRSFKAVQALCDSLKPAMEAHRNDGFRRYVKRLQESGDSRPPEVIYHHEVFIVGDSRREILSPKLEVVLTPSRGGVLLLLYPASGIFGYHVPIEDDQRFRAWGYWNNTDPPEETTSREWSQRRRDWLSILDRGDGVPAEFGFTKTLVGSSLPWPSEVYPDAAGPEL